MALRSPVGSAQVRYVLTLIVLALQRLYHWWVRKSSRDVLLETLADARLFEEWEAAAFQLDEVLGHDLWYAFPKCPEHTPFRVQD